jgi:hypothetical protein
VFNQTAVIAPTMHVPSNLASMHTTAHLFKKQRLRLNPTFTQQQPTNITNMHSLEDRFNDDDADDDDVSLSQDDAGHQSWSLPDDSSVASEESFCSDASFADTT